MNKQLTIGLFGFGTVGRGLYDVLQATPSLQSSIKKICIKDGSKQRSIAADIFTTDPGLLLNDESINVIVELTDDAEAAFHITGAAMQKGKAVVSANKKMIAEHFEELLQLQQQYKVPFLYEAACCASIPIIRNLEEYYDNDLLHSFRGIVNGSTNFILTKMFAENLNFNEALLMAQQLGFAESNPVLDTGGFDAVNKLSILLAHAFGIIAKPGAILFSGIQNISLQDIVFAKEKKKQIKLTAFAQKLEDGKLAAYVLPQFVNAVDELYRVENEFNAVITESSFADRHFFKGKGAGAFPTASAVLSDIGALRYDYRYEYKKISSQNKAVVSSDFFLKVYVRAEDKNQIKQPEFEWIDEWYQQGNSVHICGVIHAEKLMQQDWWKKNGVSLIVYPEGIVKDVEYKKVSRRSLELAGVL